MTGITDAHMMKGALGALDKARAELTTAAGLLEDVHLGGGQPYEVISLARMIDAADTTVIAIKDALERLIEDAEAKQ